MSMPREDVPPTPHPARHVFSTKGLAIATLVILSAFVGTTYLARDFIGSGGLAAVVTATLVDLANSDRSEENLGNLKISPVLVEAAQAKANDMAEKGYFAHNSPEGLTSWHWFSEAGYSFSYAGENLAVNFSDSMDVENAWMKSPTHRANIMNGKFTEIGIATAVGEYKGKETVFVVQMFGTPRAVAASGAPRPVTASETPEDIAIATTEEEPTATNTLAVAVTNPVPQGEQVLAESADSVTRYAGWFESLLASPHALLRTIYILCALVILIALGFTTRMELVHHHTRHVVAAALLLIFMTGLFAVADRFVFTDPVITLTSGIEGGG